MICEHVWQLMKACLQRTFCSYFPSHRITFGHIGSSIEALNDTEQTQ